MEDLVEKLEGAVKVDLDPAWGILDGGAGVVAAPTLDKAQPQDAQTSQVIHTDASRC